MRVAVVGSGITGLSAAWIISNNPEHSVSLFESGDYLGGHTNTVDIKNKEGKAISVDTGFIVYNELNYPNLTGVATEPSDMSFALSLNQGELEWAGESLSTIFAQKSNIFSWAHWEMLFDILKFGREAPKILDKEEFSKMTMGEFLARHGFTKSFIERYLFPITSAIWSLPPTGTFSLLFSTGGALDFPAQAMVQFLHNHQMLQIFDRPQWRCVSGGSRQYVLKIRERLEANECAIHLKTPVTSVSRVQRDGRLIVQVEFQVGDQKKVEEFDQIVFACHADTALKLLSDPSEYEQKVLGCFKYSLNEAVLHSDPSLMPRVKKTWSSWNYLRFSDKNELVLTYWMNRLQPFVGNSTPLFVTLNPPHPPLDTYRTISYTHPLFFPEKEIVRNNGQRNTHFAGAYMGWGFHEDGLIAGLRVGLSLQGKCPWPVDYGRYDTPKKKKGESAEFGVSSWADHVFMTICAVVTASAVGYALFRQFLSQ